MKNRLLIGIISTLFISITLMTSPIQYIRFVLGVGSTAINIELISTEGKKVKISDFVGKKVALVFLPSASMISFHCTAQACSIKARFEDLAYHGIEPVCVSGSSINKLKKFIKKNKLTFPMFHADKYALRSMRSYPVNERFGIQRHTLLINENGIIKKIITDVDIDNHAQQILDGFDIA